MELIGSDLVSVERCIIKYASGDMDKLEIEYFYAPSDPCIGLILVVCFYLNRSTFSPLSLKPKKKKIGIEFQKA